MPVSNKAIPAGHTFLNILTFMSIQGRDLVVGLFAKARNRNPDAFDMYIYNDFYSYAVLDLLDKTLATANSKITKKDYDEAYCILEGLTVFNELDSSWLACDDGGRIEVTNKAYGAAVVSLLRGIGEAGRLNSAQFPSLEDFLRRAAEWGKDMKDMSSGTDYDLFCKAVGKRLFENKTPDHLALDKARLVEFGKSLPEDQAIEVKNRIKKLEKEFNEKKPWFVGARSSDEHDDNPDFVLSRVWREYKGYLQGVPKKPLRGGPGWDITKWPDTTKVQFVFDGGSGDELDDY